DQVGIVGESRPPDGPVLGPPASRPGGPRGREAGAADRPPLRPPGQELLEMAVARRPDPRGFAGPLAAPGAPRDGPPPRAPRPHGARAGPADRRRRGRPRPAPADRPRSRHALPHHGRDRVPIGGDAVLDP